VTVHENRLVVAVDLIVGSDTELSSLLLATIDAVLGSVRTWHATVTEMLDGEFDPLGLDPLGPDPLGPDPLGPDPLG
jgi:hypothetical protein